MSPLQLIRSEGITTLQSGVHDEHCSSKKQEHHGLGGVSLSQQLEYDKSQPRDIPDQLGLEHFLAKADNRAVEVADSRISTETLIGRSTSAICRKV